MVRPKKPLNKKMISAALFRAKECIEADRIRMEEEKVFNSEDENCQREALGQIVYAMAELQRRIR